MADDLKQLPSSVWSARQRWGAEIPNATTIKVLSDRINTLKLPTLDASQVPPLPEWASYLPRHAMIVAYNQLLLGLPSYVEKGKMAQAGSPAATWEGLGDRCTIEEITKRMRREMYNQVAGSYENTQTADIVAREAQSLFDTVQAFVKERMEERAAGTQGHAAGFGGGRG